MLSDDDHGSEYRSYAEWSASHVRGYFVWLADLAPSFLLPSHLRRRYPKIFHLTRVTFHQLSSPQSWSASGSIPRFSQPSAEHWADHVCHKFLLSGHGGKHQAPLQQREVSNNQRTTAGHPRLALVDAGRVVKQLSVQLTELILTHPPVIVNL